MTVWEAKWRSGLALSRSGEQTPRENLTLLLPTLRPPVLSDMRVEAPRMKLRQFGGLI